MFMAGESSRKPNFLAWVLMAALVTQAVVTPVMCRGRLAGLGDQKNYYPPDPHKRSHKPPSCPTPSVHGTPPSHGGGGYGTPPSHGGGGYGTPSPSHGGGGGYYAPPAIIPPPTTPGIDPGTPTFPLVPPSPTFPLVPPTPGVSTPPSPLIPDPNIPPFFTGTCNYWRTHPQLIWGLFGYWGTLGGVLGVAGARVSNLSLLQALGNTRSDGIGALYREGTASFLNTMVNRKFPFTTKQVKDAFAAALSSDRAAAAQAQLFKRANEGRLRHGKHN